MHGIRAMLRGGHGSDREFMHPCMLRYRKGVSRRPCICRPGGHAQLGYTRGWNEVLLRELSNIESIHAKVQEGEAIYVAGVEIKRP